MRAGLELQAASNVNGSAIQHHMWTPVYERKIS
jgi:hypothetical protein